VTKDEIVVGQIIGLDNAMDVNLLELVKRAIMNAGHYERKKRMRWVYVHEMFAHGSGVSQALCRFFGLDPYELI